MQNFGTSFVTNKVTGFISKPPSNTIQWVSFSTVKASDVNSFGASTQAVNSQQILSVSAAGGVEYFYVQGPFAVADFGGLKKSSIHVSQLPASIAKAIAAVGTCGKANMLTMTIPSSVGKKPSPTPAPSFVGSVSFGITWETLLIPVCAGQANWVSIGLYGVILIALILIWWFWIRRV